MNPKISIITITFNSDKYLEQTICSVSNQTYSNKEYIVVDGCSTDNTFQIINRHKDEIDVFQSEPDEGIADAMNKGLALATGDYLIFLHSDDYFADTNSLADAVEYLSTDFEIFLFDIIFSAENVNRSAKPRGLNWWMNFKTGVFHQSAICARSLFNRIGDFDTDFSIAMDYDFFLRAYRNKARTKKINFPLSVMRLSGVSSRLDWASLKKRFQEERLAQFKNNISITMRGIYFLYWSLYLPYRYCKSCIGRKS